MNAHFTYLAVDVCSLLLPLIFSFHPRIGFYREWRHLTGPGLTTASLFITWDLWFTKLGIWHFNPALTLGIGPGGLPLEEYLFFICIPYASIFLWYCVDQNIELVRFRKRVAVVSGCLGILLVITGIIYCNRAYTSSTFIGLGTVLFFLSLKKPGYLASFFVSYLVTLIPFFIANGILTGMYTGRAVVIYNDQANLGIRLGTIPVEDIGYGMLLILMNVTGYSFSKRKVIS